MKKIFFLLYFLSCALLSAMENQWLKKDSDGMTPLHHCSLMPLEAWRFSNYSELDQGKAQAAAILILKFSANVNEPNAWYNTPLKYSEMLKDKFPKVYEVMKAGKIKQEIEKKLPKSSTNDYCDYQQVSQNVQRNVITNEELNAWKEASDILYKYSETNWQQANEILKKYALSVKLMS